MKSQDIAMLVVVGVVAGVLSLGISNFFFNAEKQQLKAEVVTEIKATFADFDAQYINEQSINPTVNIKIGENDNENPFSAQ